MSMGFVFDRKDAKAPSLKHSLKSDRRSALSSFLTTSAAVVAGGVVVLPLAALTSSLLTGGTVTAGTLFFGMMAMALEAPVFLAALIISAAGLAIWQVLWLAELAHKEHAPTLPEPRTMGLQPIPVRVRRFR